MFRAMVVNWKEHSGHMVGMSNACIILVIHHERRDFFEGVGVDANITFNWT
jgi:hypothetical protein